MPWYLGSLALHLLIFCLFLLFAPEPRPRQTRNIIITTNMMERNEDTIKTEIPETDIFDQNDMEQQNDPQLISNALAQVDLGEGFNVDLPDPTASVIDDATTFIGTLEEAPGASQFTISSFGKNNNGIGINASEFSSRSGVGKQSKLRKFGGDRTTEAALNLGLGYLARHQSSDGSWKLFPNEKYFSGRFGFTKERHLKVHSDSRGMRHEWCMGPVTIPETMTLAVSLDHVDDHAYIFINDTRHGPFPDRNDHADANWKGEFPVNQGDLLRVQVVSNRVGNIWCVGRYWNAKFSGPKVMKRAPYFRTDAGLTALCTLSFLGAGNTAKIGKYKRNVRKAQQFLLNFSYSEFGTELPAPIAYEAPLMIMALSELYGMDGDPRVKRKAQQLIDMGVKYQLDNGGWPHNMANDKTGSWHNTTWWLSALKSARMAGLKVPNKVFNKTIKSIRKCIKLEGEHYANIKEVEGYPRVMDKTSKMEASMAVYLLNMIKGEGLDDQKIKAMCELMVRAGTNRDGVWDWPGANLGFMYNGKLTYPAELFESESKRNKPGKGHYTSYYLRSIEGFPSSSWGSRQYMRDLDKIAKQLPNPSKRWYSGTYWYWQGNSFSRLGYKSPYWIAWNNHFKPYLIYTQATGGKWPRLVTADKEMIPELEKGDINGSWPGIFLKDGCGPFEDMGAFGATAFCCLMLEVYYRY